MASSDDLKEHAASSEDFYALLGLESTAQESEIRRAYRRTALKYHPDKISNPTPADIDKFHLLQIAYDVLSEPTVRQLYDNAREARLRKKREAEMLQGVRRKMKEDLEARERGVKRTWEAANANARAEQNAQERLDAEIRRLAEDGARRRRQKEELMRREILEEEEREEQEREEQERAKQEERRARRGNVGGTTVPEEDRMVKVRWARDNEIGESLDKDRISKLFSRFGKIDSSFSLKDKKQRLGDKKEKKLVATVAIVFESIVGAYAAVEDSKKQQGSEWDVIDSVSWAKGQAPDFDFESLSSSTQQSQTNTPEPAGARPTATGRPRNLYSFPGLNMPASKEPTTTEKDAGKKAPSFASFGSAAATSHRAKPSANQPDAGGKGPSLEEITLIRLRNAERAAERERLAEQLQTEDEAAEAAEEAKQSVPEHA